MRIEEDDLEWAVSKGVIGRLQADALWQALSERAIARPHFGLIVVLYYFGALLVIGAMSWFMTSAWESFGGGGILLISAIYAAIFFGVGAMLFDREGLRIPGGLLVTIGVCMTPLAIYGLQRWLNIWFFDDPGEYRSFHLWIKGGWFFMEAATICVGFVALRFFRFPFLTAPIAFALWYMSMDLTPIIFQDDDSLWEKRTFVSLWFGLAMIAGSYFVDRRTKEDYSFWGYLFGSIAFWGGISVLGGTNEMSNIIYLLINVLLIGLSVFLQRKVFIIFGAIGSIGSIGHLAYDVFANSIWFPFSLSIAGVIILYGGVLLHRHGRKIEEGLTSVMPNWMRDLRPSVR